MEALDCGRGVAVAVGIGYPGDVMVEDRYGLPISATSAAARDAYVEGVDCLLSANVGAEAAFDRAIAADPGFALACIGRARSLQLQARVAEAREAAVRARGLVAGGTARERGHVEALAIAVEGDARRGLAAIAEHLVEFPRDAMVLSPATGVYGLIGFSGRHDRNEALAALLDPLATAYGEDWWFLAAHGFALTEARGWAAGAPLVERSLALSPRNAHAAHAWAHVLYERGDDRDGAAFVDAWLPGYAREAQLHCHLSWHLALFDLAGGRLDRAAEIYRESIRPGVALSPAMPALADCASLLWRSFPKIGIGFADAHCAVAYAAAGDQEMLERWIAALRTADEEGRLASGSALPMVAEALGAFARGDDKGAIRLLELALDRFVRIGGSRAQRDLFENTLLAAYWRSGQGAAAAGLLERRLDREPTVPRPSGA